MLALGSVHAQDAPTACDRLKAHPEVFCKIVPGVAPADIDQPAANADCETALEDDPVCARSTH